MILLPGASKAGVHMAKVEKCIFEYFASYAAELADDLAQGCPMDLGSAMFDDDWDRKYVHGGG